MEGVEPVSYQLSDRFLSDYLDRQPEEMKEALLQGLTKLRREEAGPRSSKETSDVDAAVEPLRTIQTHQSWVGLSTGPTVWSLANYYAEKSQIPRPIQVLLNDYDFYLLRFGVHLDPRKGEKFVELMFYAKYSGDNCFTYDQLPSTKLERIVSGHAGVDFGLKADLSFGAEFPKLPLASGVSIGAEGKAEAAVDVHLVLKLDFDWKIQRVVSVGPDRSEAQWRMRTVDLVGFVPLYVIIRAPKLMPNLGCTIYAEYMIDMPGWFAGKVEYQTMRVPLSIKLAEVPEPRR